VTERSRVRFPACPPSGNNVNRLCKLFRHVPLSPGSISFATGYCTAMPYGGEVTVGLASYWSCARLQWYLSTSSRSNEWKKRCQQNSHKGYVHFYLFTGNPLTYSHALNMALRGTRPPAFYFVCPSVCPLAYLRNHTAVLSQFFAHWLWPWLDPFLAVLCNVMHLRFCE